MRVHIRRQKRIEANLHKSETPNARNVPEVRFTKGTGNWEYVFRRKSRSILTLAGFAVTDFVFFVRLHPVLRNVEAAQ